MNRSFIQQYLLVVAGAALVVSLYFFGDTKSRPALTKPEAGNAGHVGKAVSMSFEKILSLAGNTLSAMQKDSVSILTNLVEKKSGAEKTSAIKKLAELWSRTENFIVSAHYFEEIAKLDSTKDNWKIAGDYYYFGFSGTTDSAAKVFGGEHAVNCYAVASKFDSTDTKIKVLQALSWIDGVGGMNTMNGVLLLKEIEKTDPDNELMNVTLGRLAVVSGQYDKAIERLQRTIKLYPENTEAYFHLGEAYRATGRKSDAVKMFEQCKKLESSPDFQKQLDDLINQLKK